MLNVLKWLIFPILFIVRADSFILIEGPENVSVINLSALTNYNHVNSVL